MILLNFLKVWCVENNESEAMRIVYRMRGLLGDATEEFIENLDTKDNEEVDNEEVYKMANVMSECGGLEVMLERMSTITDLSRGRSLLTVLLKLFGFCIKVCIYFILYLMHSLLNLLHYLKENYFLKNLMHSNNVSFISIIQ